MRRHTHAHHCMWKLGSSTHRCFLQADFLSGLHSSYCCCVGCERSGSSSSARAARFRRICDNLGENAWSMRHLRVDGIGQSMLAQTHAPAAILSQMAEAVAVSAQTHGSVRIILVRSVWPGRVDRLSKPIGKPTINRLILTSLTSSIGGST